MKIESRTVATLCFGLVVYFAAGPGLDRCRGLVDSLVLAELLSRVIIRAKQ